MNDNMPEARSHNYIVDTPDYISQLINVISVEYIISMMKLPACYVCFVNRLLVCVCVSSDKIIIYSN